MPQQSYRKSMEAARKATADKYGLRVKDRQANETYQQYYDKLAKKADRRMRELEKLATSDPQYKNVLNMAYRDAVESLRDLGVPANKAGKTRFTRKSPNTQNLKARINVATRFLESTSSSKKALDRLYKERVDNLNKSMGLKGSDKLDIMDLEKLFNSKLWKESGLGSDEVIKAYAVMKKIGTPNKIKRDVDITKMIDRYASDEVEADKIDGILHERGYNF